MDKWINFYVPFFGSRSETQAFVESYEVMDVNAPKHPAKIMMHQTQRLISLADELPRIRPGKESLQLLFLLICAEHIAKLHDNFEGEGKSRFYVRHFFNNLLTDKEKNQLRLGFSKFDRTPFGLHEIIDFLYYIRCDVVHEGKYWAFHFNHDGLPMLNTEPDVIANISLDQLRAIVVEGCINAVKTYAGSPNNANSADAKKQRG